MIKNIFKKITLGIFLSLFLFAPFINPVMAESNKQEINFFGSPTCPHCIKEKQFFKDLKNEHPEIQINEYTFSENTELINKLYKEYEVTKNQQGLVPATFIGDRYFIGFNENIQKQIEDYLFSERASQNNELNDDEKIKAIWGQEINIKNFSLPALSIVLGIVDGFNVCSLGALVIILGLVMVLGSRKRILLLGGTFLLITGLTYGLLIFLWHQLFTLITPYVKSMELLIGALSIIGGIYLFKEFIKSYKQGPNCSSSNLLGKLSPKIEKIFANKKNLAILLSVVALFSLVITVVEFPCSAFLPVLFSGILAEANLSFGQTFSYMAIYIIFYLLDEVIIFLIAFFTMKIKIVSPRFIIFFNLLAALIFLFLGSYYIIRIFL